MSILKQSTTYNRVFRMVTSASHYLPLTSATPVVNISKASGTFDVAAGSVAEIANGFYRVALTAADTNTLGDLAYFITAASGDDVFLVDQVQLKLFPDLSIDANGRANISSNIKQNTALNGLTFVMTNTTTHSPATGLTVAAQRSLGGAGFSPCANTVSEISNGVYSINLAAADTNAGSVMLRFTATGADDLNILLNTQP